ncbi:MAG: hypothetical protein FJ295_14570 [Planctomycetes bacterium]|nr:hypothetical protein [Planctomycetota bacterium]
MSKVVKDLQRREIFFCITRDLENHQLFAGASDGRVYRVIPECEPPVFLGMDGHRGYVTGVICARGCVISAAFDGALIWWDPVECKPLRKVPAHARWIRGLALSPDESWFASVGDDMVCRIWDTESGLLRRELTGHAPRTPQHFPSMLFAVAIAADGQQLATADKVGKINVWEVSSGAVLRSIQAETMYTWDPKQRIHSIGGVRSLCFSPDGRQLLAGGMGQVGNIDHLEGKSRMEQYDLERGDLIHAFEGELKGLVEKLVWHPQGQVIGMGGDHGGFVQIYDLSSRAIVQQEKTAAHIHDFVSNDAVSRYYAACHGRIAILE